MEKENIIIKWLKRIFTVQTLSVIVAIVAAYYTYQMYMDSRPTHIDMQYYEWDWDNKEYIISDVKNTKVFWSLFFSDAPYIQLNHHTDTPIPIYKLIGFPIISNSSSKSLEHFECHVTIHFDESMKENFKRSLEKETQEGHIRILDPSVDFQVERWTDNTVELKYSSNFLAAGRGLPEPFYELYLGSLNDDNDHPEEGYNISLRYFITYDGLKEPISFVYRLTVYVSDEYEGLKVDENLMRKYLKDNIYQKGVSNDYNQEESWAFILNNHLINNIKHSYDGDIFSLTEENIEKSLKLND